MKRRQDSHEPFTWGGGALGLWARKNIVHLHYDCQMTAAEIAPLIFSPRVEGSVCVRTVERVLEFFESYWHVEDVPRAPRACKMPEDHFQHLAHIVADTPWLYLDEIAEELQKRCRGMRYLPGLCYQLLKRRGYSLKKMRWWSLWGPSCSTSRRTARSTIRLRVPSIPSRAAGVATGPRSAISRCT
jgi:transposase